MTCFCRGGPTCCMRAGSWPNVPDWDKPTGPFKCPDCGAWWVGLYHLCAPDQSGIPCTCPSGYYVGDWICGRHNPTPTTGVSS